MSDKQHPITCPYCGKELPDNHTLCCGEIGHGCEHKNFHYEHGYAAGGLEADIFVCEDCDYRGEPE